MPSQFDSFLNRRKFIRYLAASPLLGFGLTQCSSEESEEAIQAKMAITEMGEFSEGMDNIITSEKDALNVFDFRGTARQNLSLAHYAYLETGVDDNITVRANREEFKNIEILAHRIVDVSRNKIDMSTEIFGEKWETPIGLSPVSSQKAFYDEGEIATAKAAKNKNTLQILSNYTTSSIENVNEAREAPVWFQMYPATTWEVTKKMIDRVEQAGTKVLVLTVDTQAGSNREIQRRFKRQDNSICITCHIPGINRKEMINNIDYDGSTGLTWAFVKRLRDYTKCKLVIKGIMTSEDAQLCTENGIDGIIVSNHGGRTEESCSSTIECLPEVVAAVDNKIPVLIDGGFRRGTDIFKALAIGAKAACIGRPYIWGLASFGQSGVEKVLDLLRIELRRIMQQAGTVSLKNINENYILHHTNNK